jgi:hypothetical protein
MMSCKFIIIVCNRRLHELFKNNVQKQDLLRGLSKFKRRVVTKKKRCYKTTRDQYNEVQHHLLEFYFKYHLHLKFQEYMGTSLNV